MMKRCLLVIALMALILMAITPVNAINVSFSSIDGSADRDMYLYQGGVLVGLYNTSSTGISLTDDTEIVFRPQTQNILENPGLWLSDTAIPYVMTNALGIIFTFGVALLVLGRR